MRSYRRRNNQRGLASIMVVLILIILITIIGISFTKIMDRALQNSSQTQQASAADYAARSALNDAISYIRGNPTVSNPSNCGQLLSTSDPNKVNPNLSADGSVKYTCFLVDPNPTSLVYQGIDAYKSQLVHIKASADNLLVSWQATDRQYNLLPKPSDGTNLLDETSWALAKYEPVFRLGIYPVKNKILQTPNNFFLYPQSSNNNNATSIAGSSGNPFQTVRCGGNVTSNNFAENPAYDCKAVITGLAGLGDDFYLRLTPIYHASSVQIQANDNSNNKIKFSGVQSVVDVTASGGSSVKRLQARIDSDSSGGNVSFSADSLPEVALRSANTLCKRLIISSATSAATDASSTDCPLLGSQPPPHNQLRITISHGGDGVYTTDGHIHCYATGPCVYDYGPSQPTVTVVADRGGDKFDGWNCPGGTVNGVQCTIKIGYRTTVQATFSDNCGGACLNSQSQNFQY